MFLKFNWRQSHQNGIDNYRGKITNSKFHYKENITIRDQYGSLVMDDVSNKVSQLVKVVQQEN